MKNFLYILTHASGDLTPTYSPLNWDKFNIVFKRSKKYHSILRRQILDSDFPLDGKAYIDNIYNTFGIDTVISIDLQYLDKQTLNYSTLFQGIIDLSEWSSLRDTTSVKIIDSDVMAKFAARDQLKIPINRLVDLDGDNIGPGFVPLLNTMTVEGVTAELKAQYENTSNAIAITAQKDGNDPPWTEYYGITAAPYDFNEIGAKATLPAVSLPGASGPIYENTTGSSITVRYRFTVKVIGDVEVVGTMLWSWRIRCFVDTGVPNAIIDIQDTGSGNDSHALDTTFASTWFNASISPGNTINLYQLWEGLITGPGTDTVTPTFNFEPTLVEVVEVFTAEADTDVQMPLLHELGAKLLATITGESDPLDAPLLGRTDSTPRDYVSDGDHSLNGVASGFMLRGFPGKPLTTSFADFFKSIDGLFNLGFWHNGTDFTISDKADFYKVSEIISLGEVQELEISVASDEYFNTVLAGYSKDVSYEEVNGAQAFNTPFEFVNDGKRIQNSLDIRSKYRGDDYGIEFARQSQYDDSASEDTRYDNEIFFVIGQRAGGDYSTLQGLDNFTAISGVYSPDERLNLDITPKRNMLRHANQLSIPLFVSDGDTNYMKSQYDLDLSTTKSGDPAIVETDDLAIGDLDEPLYYPEMYNFKSQLSIANVLQLISDPHGYVTFLYLGVTYSGYIVEVSSEPFNRRGNWTLLKRNPNR